MRYHDSSSTAITTKPQQIIRHMRGTCTMASLLTSCTDATNLREAAIALWCCKELVYIFGGIWNFMDSVLKISTMPVTWSIGKYNLPDQ